MTVARGVEPSKEVPHGPLVGLEVVPQRNEEASSELLQVTHFDLVLDKEVARLGLFRLALLHRLHHDIQLHVVQRSIPVGVDKPKELLHFLEVRRWCRDGRAEVAGERHEGDTFHQLLRIDGAITTLVELAKEVFRSHFAAAHVVRERRQNREASLFQLRHFLEVLVDPRSLRGHLRRCLGLLRGDEVFLGLLDLTHLDPELLQAGGHHQHGFRVDVGSVNRNHLHGITRPQLAVLALAQEGGHLDHVADLEC
mmetsp:Transcript_19794/g.46745  ORF Transcript_19794/g.46745 Transcript_19794/m.46745 type:complete len:253 (+) Transcript_19794:974-1732(+)